MNQIARALLKITLAFGAMSILANAAVQAGAQPLKSEALPPERPLPNATYYNSQFTNCFPNESIADPKPAKVYVCGAVQKPQVLKLEDGMTVGAAIAKCGGLDDKAFAVNIVRKRNNAYSLITIRLIADSYKPTGYGRIPLQKDDLIVVSRESF